MKRRAARRARSAGRNAEVIAGLRGRRTRLLAWFLSFVLLMPLGCVGPCLLGAVVPNETAKTVFFVPPSFCRSSAWAGSCSCSTTA